MAYSAEERAAAQGIQDWLNAGNQWMVDMMGWDWFFQTQPQFAPYRYAVLNYQKVLAEPTETAPTPAPTTTTTTTQQTAPTSSGDPLIGKTYQRIQDIPEGYEWSPTTVFGTPMTDKEAINRQIEAMQRGELTDYQKQFTYQITKKKPEGVLTPQGPGLYTYVKDGKEYVYAPKEFVNYGAKGAESETGELGRPLAINSLLKSKDLLDKATKINIDPKQFQSNLDNAGIKDAYQGYSWKKQDYLNGVYALSGGRPTAYNYNPDDAFSLGNRTIYPEQYGDYQGQDDNGNYIYKKGKNTTVFDPKTATGTTYWPGDDGGLGGFLPFIALAGLAFGIPAGLELLAGEAASAGALGAGFGELSAAELASYGVTAETLGLGAAGGTSLANAGWDPNWLSTVGQGSGDIAAGEALGSILTEGGFGELSANELANLGYDASWADTLGGTTGLEAWDGYEPPANWETADMSPVETIPQPTTTTPAETAPNLEGGDLGEGAPNLEGGDLGMTEAEWQDQFYKDIGIDPSSLSDLPPATTAEIESILNQGPNVSLSDLNKVRQMVNVSKLLQGAGLLGGTAVAANAAKGLLGGLGTGAGTGAGIKAPTPFTGTYSGSGPSNPAYFQQVQQNYNRLFPTAPADVATPLQSWYQTKFVPDTNISNKLFGV
jgi:hypothetical protein